MMQSEATMWTNRSRQSVERLYTRAEIEATCSPEHPVIIIHDCVYDVTTLLPHHPGGEKVLLEQAGGDATQSFEYVNHSSDALSLMEAYKIGRLVEADCVADDAVVCCSDDSQDEGEGWSSFIIAVLLCLAIFIIYYGLSQ